ncbi:hypothetical protein NE237_018075 [Protea cynaroides]|uniref:Uncharacterized protein n=1 Tax=Protea cynaroides TaxID=273540 RepID=A0A9Q0K9C5_9MAGN|nr:hypothetical protein NE237_018075 [Protea cynaroides]
MVPNVSTFEFAHNVMAYYWSFLLLLLKTWICFSFADDIKPTPNGPNPRKKEEEEIIKSCCNTSILLDGNEIDLPNTACRCQFQSSSLDSNSGSFLSSFQTPDATLPCSLF